jgi:hypothetical protein
MKHARILEFLSIIQQYGFLNTPLVFEKWKSTWEMPSNGRWALPRGRMREGGERETRHAPVTYEGSQQQSSGVFVIL